MSYATQNRLTALEGFMNPMDERVQTLESLAQHLAEEIAHFRLKA